jgi:hypothetical protein
LIAATIAVCSLGWNRARASQLPPANSGTLVWHQLGSWSGHGSMQTESFTSDTGTLRVRWEATPPSSTPNAPFRLTAHSAISGRPLQQVVEYAGAGAGVDYVQQDPHVFYMVIDAKDVNWRFTVEEAIGYR